MTALETLRVTHA